MYFTLLKVRILAVPSTPVYRYLH